MPSGNAVLLFIGALILLKQLNKKNDLLIKPVKHTDGIQATCLATMIFSGIMFIAAFGILTHFDIGSTTLRAARNTVDESSLIKGNVAGNAVIAQDNDSTNYVNKISVDWNYLGNDDEQRLIDVTHNSKQVIYTSKSKIDRAYLRIGQYIDNNTKHPVNLTWTLKPYLVKASYDDENVNDEDTAYDTVDDLMGQMLLDERSCLLVKTAFNESYTSH